MLSRNWSGQAEKEKKKFFRIIPTWPELENSEKNSEKNQKIKKHHPGFISSRNSYDSLKKREKKFLCEPFLPNPSYRVPKKISKIKKDHLGFISSRKGSGQAEKERKKISVLARSELENSQKN